MSEHVTAHDSHAPPRSRRGSKTGIEMLDHHHHHHHHHESANNSKVNSRRGSKSDLNDAAMEAALKLYQPVSRNNSNSNLNDLHHTNVNDGSKSARSRRQSFDGQYFHKK